MIEKEKFLAVYNKHLPNKFTKFMFKLNLKKEGKNSPIKTNIIITWMVLFLLGFLGTVLNLPNTLIAVVTLSFAFIIVPVVTLSFIAMFMNNSRIKKIMSELSITDTEVYNEYAGKYIK